MFFDIVCNSLWFIIFFSHLRFSSLKYVTISLDCLNSYWGCSYHLVFPLLSREHLKNSQKCKCIQLSSWHSYNYSNLFTLRWKKTLIFLLLFETKISKRNSFTNIMTFYWTWNSRKIYFGVFRYNCASNLCSFFNALPGLFITIVAIFSTDLANFFPIFLESWPQSSTFILSWLTAIDFFLINLMFLTKNTFRQIFLYQTQNLLYQSKDDP